MLSSILFDNLILITSIINTPDIPLSYSNIRSYYTNEERFQQTVNTIKTIKDKIPNVKIMIVECSNLEQDKLLYLTQNCDYFLNLIDQPDKVSNIYSNSKSLGEGTMTIYALEYILKNNIIFKHFFKITGRYYLTEEFNYSNFNNYNIVCINGNLTNSDNYKVIHTSFYKIYYSNIKELLEYLISNTDLMRQCYEYENILGVFINLPKKNNIIYLDKIGIKGQIASIQNCLYEN